MSGSNILKIISRYIPGIVLLVLLWNKAEGQRVYANASQQSPTQALIVTLSEVQNPGFALNDGNYNNNSTLFTTLGALSLIEAWQNLQFTGVNKPVPNSPLYLKIGSNGISVGSMVAGMELRRTNGGNTNFVAPVYSGTSLSTLMGAGAGGTSAEVMIPSTGQAYDGVRFRVSSTVLGIAISGYFYYAFFIVAPNVPNQTVCYGNTTSITVINNQPNFYYKWYDAATGGNLLQNSQSAVYITPALTATKDYFVEAVDSTATIGYASARSKVTIAVQPTPHPSPPLTSFQ